METDSVNHFSEKHKGALFDGLSNVEAIALDGDLHFVCRDNISFVGDPHRPQASLGRYVGKIVRRSERTGTAVRVEA